MIFHYRVQKVQSGQLHVVGVSLNLKVVLRNEFEIPLDLFMVILSLNPVKKIQNVAISGLKSLTYIFDTVLDQFDYHLRTDFGIIMR